MALRVRRRDLRSPASWWANPREAMELLRAQPADTKWRWSTQAPQPRHRAVTTCRRRCCPAAAMAMAPHAPGMLATERRKMVLVDKDGKAQVGTTTATAGLGAGDEDGQRIEKRVQVIVDDKGNPTARGRRTRPAGSGPAAAEGRLIHELRPRDGASGLSQTVIWSDQLSLRVAGDRFAVAGSALLRPCSRRWLSTALAGAAPARPAAWKGSEMRIWCWTITDMAALPWRSAYDNETHIQSSGHATGLCHPLQVERIVESPRDLQRPRFCSNW